MLFSLILFLAAYLPFQIALDPTAGVDLASIRVVILLAFFLWLAKGLKDKKINIPANFQTSCVAAFLFLNLFSLVFAKNAVWGVRKLLFLFSIFPIYFIVAGVVRKKADFKKASAWLVISGTVAAALGVMQFVGQFFIGINKLSVFWANCVAGIFLGKTFTKTVLAYPSWLVNISGRTYFRAISVFPDPHMLSFFLGLLLPLAVALFFEGKKKGWLFCASVIFLADIITFSRGGYLGLVGGAAFLLFIFQSKLANKYRALIFIGLACLLLALAIPGPVSARFFSSFNLEEGSNAGRLAMWRVAGKNILAHPAFGVGIGNFPLAVSPLADYREPIYAHNTYLDIAVEAGILAAVAWVGMLFFAWREFLKKAKRSQIYLGAASSLVIFSVHSLVETGIYSPVVLTLVLMVVAFSNIRETDEKIS